MKMKKNDIEEFIAEYRAVVRLYPRAAAFHFIAGRLCPDYSPDEQARDRAVDLKIQVMEDKVRQLGGGQ